MSKINIVKNDQGFIETQFDGVRRDLLESLVTALQNDQFRELVSEAMMLTMTYEQEQLLSVEETAVPFVPLARG